MAETEIHVDPIVDIFYKEPGMRRKFYKHLEKENPDLFPEMPPNSIPYHQWIKIISEYEEFAEAAWLYMVDETFNHSETIRQCWAIPKDMTEEELNKLALENAVDYYADLYSWKGKIFQVLGPFYEVVCTFDNPEEAWEDGKRSLKKPCFLIPASEMQKGISRQKSWEEIIPELKKP